MVDITEISAVVAAVGVVIGVVYYILDMRHQGKTREMDMIMRLYSYYCSEEFSRASGRYLAAEFKDLEDFEEKYGIVGENPVTTASYVVATFFEGVGALLKRKLADPRLLYDLFMVKTYWKKVEPIIEDLRQRFEEPKLYENFEYLYNELKKREQAGVKNG